MRLPTMRPRDLGADEAYYLLPVRIVVPGGLCEVRVPFQAE